MEPDKVFENKYISLLITVISHRMKPKESHQRKIVFKYVGADISDIIIVLPLLLLNSHIVFLSEGAVVVWEKASSVLCCFGN